MIIEKYLIGENADAVIESVNGKYYIIYNPNDCPCHCGPFDDLDAARETLKRHRPKATKA